MDRYARQIALPQIGQAGQDRLADARAAIIGCGALGTVLCNHLVRAGVGYVRIIDRDFIELNNLQRQILFDEDDIAQGLPKAIAAALKLKRINTQVTVEPIVTDIHPGNIEEMIGGIDIVLDGTDNFETRFLINDACVKHDIPWVYAGVVSTYGMTMAVIPHKTACLRCLMEDIPDAGSTPTCDTAGVLSTAVDVVASLEAAEAFKWLTGHNATFFNQLIHVDVWTGDLKRLSVKRAPNTCPTCGLGRFDFLEAREGSVATRLCGKNAVQVNLHGLTRINLSDLAARLGSVGTVAHNDYMLRLQVTPYEITLFPDGRAIIQGTDDEAMARTLYARYIGV